MKCRICLRILVALVFYCADVACTRNEDSLESIFGQKIFTSETAKSGTFIVLMSESDCGSCTAMLLAKFEKISNNSKGLFFGKEQSASLGVVKAATQGRIDWHTTTDKSAFLWAARETKSKKGPYIVHITGASDYTVTVLE